MGFRACLAMQLYHLVESTPERDKMFSCFALPQIAPKFDRFLQEIDAPEAKASRLQPIEALRNA